MPETTFGDDTSTRHTVRKKFFNLLCLVSHGSHERFDEGKMVMSYNKLKIWPPLIPKTPIFKFLSLFGYKTMTSQINNISYNVAILNSV